MQEGYGHKAGLPMKSIFLLKQGHTSERSSCALFTALIVASTPYVNMDLVPELRERGLVRGDCWGCNQICDRLDKKLKKVKGKPMPNSIRDVREKLSNVTWWGTWSSHPLKIPLKTHWHLLLLWRATSCSYYSFNWEKPGSSTHKLTCFNQHITLENLFSGFI